MDQVERAQAFASLHQAGDPLVLYNIWDAGSARAVEAAGAKAVATGSWSVAEAQGYADGEAIPLDFLLRIAARIAASVAIPFTLDFEGAYAVEPQTVAANVTAVIGTGAVGINFEDRVVAGEGLHPIELQAERVRAARAAADAAGVPLYLNARTDLFLEEEDRSHHAALMPETLERAAAYAEAGASGFFVPGLVEASLIARLCAETSLPVNVMAMPGAPSGADLAAAGVARISHGPGPFRSMLRQLRKDAAAALS